MSATEWLRARAVELGASLCTAAVLIAGLAAGVPFLRARIPEVFLYSFCCVSAVLLRAGIDLAIRAVMLVARAFAGAHIMISPLSSASRGSCRTSGARREISRPGRGHDGWDGPLAEGRRRWDI